MEQVCIIGCGVVGLTSALFLQQAGVDVLLVDSKGVANNCSAGNAGHFATEQVFPLAHPSLLLKLPQMLLNPLGPLHIRTTYLLQALPWFRRFLQNMSKNKRISNHLAISSLNHSSIASWQKLLHSMQLTEHISYQGALLVTEQQKMTALQEQYSGYRNAGIDVSWIDSSKLSAMEPDLAENLTAALDFTEVAHTPNPFALCQQLFQKYISQGGRFKQLQVKTIIYDKSSIKLLSEQDDIVTSKVIIAAGAYSAELTQQLGWKVPLEAERGYHLMLNGVGLQRPVSSLERKCIMTPMQFGLRVAGTVEFSGLKSAPSYKRAQILQQHADKLLRTPTSTASYGEPVPGSLQHAWAGDRPSLPDSLPVIGACPDKAGVYFNFGHQHLGLTQAAFSAELITDCILGRTPAINLHPFRINRF